MILDLLAVVAPVFIVAAIGFAWARTRRPFDGDTVTALVTNVGTPCLVFDTLVRLELSIDAFALVAGVTVACLAAFLALGALALTALRLPLPGLLPCLVFSNAGNMGLPLALFAFGEAGLALAIAFFATMVVLQFTVGMTLFTGRLSVAELARTPAVYAVALALVCIAGGLKPPEWVARTVGLLGGFAIPLMLLALGVALARLRVDRLADSLKVALARLAIGAVVGLAAVRLFGFDPLAGGVVALQCAMPIAVFNYLFAARYERSPETVAGAVVLSTLLAFPLLPAYLWLLL